MTPLYDIMTTVWVNNNIILIFLINVGYSGWPALRVGTNIKMRKRTASGEVTQGHVLCSGVSTVHHYTTRPLYC